jgi:hypothetical protein
MKALSHWKLIENDPAEVERLREQVRAAIEGRLKSPTVVKHHNDGSCCRRENWSGTVLRLTKGLVPDDVVAIVRNSDGTEGGHVHREDMRAINVEGGLSSRRTDPGAN